MNEPTRPQGPKDMKKEAERFAKAERLMKLAMHKAAKETLLEEMKDEQFTESDKVALLGVAAITYAAAVVEGSTGLNARAATNAMKAAITMELLPKIIPFMEEKE